MGADKVIMRHSKQINKGEIMTEREQLVEDIKNAKEDLADPMRYLRDDVSPGGIYPGYFEERLQVALDELFSFDSSFSG